MNDNDFPLDYKVELLTRRMMELEEKIKRLEEAIFGDDK